MSSSWRTYLPHRIKGKKKVFCNGWQIIGGRHWSLVIFTKLAVSGSLPGGRDGHAGWRAAWVSLVGSRQETRLVHGAEVSGDK